MTATLPPCPQCGGTLAIETSFRATDALLGGSQLKVGVTTVVALRCADCDFYAEGKR